MFYCDQCGQHLDKICLEHHADQNIGTPKTIEYLKSESVFDTRKFIVDIPPETKARPRFSKFGSVRTPQKQRKWKIDFIRKSKEFYQGIVLTDNCQIELKVTACFEIPKSCPKWEIPLMLNGLKDRNKMPDGDNVLKLIMDSMNELFWKDDRLVTTTTIRKAYSNRPCIIIELVTEYMP